jgi:hypothetical protein
MVGYVASAWLAVLGFVLAGMAGNVGAAVPYRDAALAKLFAGASVICIAAAIWVRP